MLLAALVPLQDKISQKPCIPFRRRPLTKLQKDKKELLTLVSKNKEKKKFVDLKQIGSGAFGKVYKATNTKTKVRNFSCYRLCACRVDFINPSNRY